MIFNINFMFVSCFVFFFSILCSVILYFLFIISPLYIYMYIFLQVYRPLPPGGNPIALDKYHIITRIQKLQGINCAGYS